MYRRLTARFRAVVDYDRIRAVIARPSVAYTTGLAVLLGFTIQSFMSFFPTFLIEFGGFDATTASYAFAGIFVLQGVWLPTMGRLSDRIGRDAVIAGAFFTATLALAILVTVPLTPVSAGVAVLMLGLGMSWPPAIQSRFVDNLSEENQNFGFGLVRSIYMGIGSLGSLVTGTLATTMGWQVAYGLIAVMFLLASGTLVLNTLFGSRL
jgi:MFS family permease